MHFRLTAAVLLLLPLVSGCQQEPEPAPKAAAPAPAPHVLSLIPAPEEVRNLEGAFTLSSGVPLVCPQADDTACRNTSDYLSDLIKRSRGISLQRSTQASGPAIFFRRTSDLEPEGYHLRVSPQEVEISAGSNAGLFYGAITFWQLATQEVGNAQAIVIPSVDIVDAPRFSWRGVLLDSARHYQSPEFIKSFIDAMALHKLNVLQWHLTDDQGWRLEIKKYPRLTSVGAWRTNPREARYGGYYTQDRVRDIVAYARQRHITIVPEIEMPGHALAAIVAYPKLGSTRHLPKGASGDWGVFPYLYNVDDTTFAFLEDVLTEVMALFPSPYIHVGGDEAPKEQWNASRQVQRRMHRLHVKDTEALQGYFVDRIGRFLERHDRRLIGWDEILEGHPSPKATVMSWRTVESAGDAAHSGHDVVLSPAPTLYLDYCQVVREGEPTCRGMQSTLRDVYAFDPKPTGALQQHLIGLQANIWTEHLPTGQSVSYAAFPRLTALAESAWSPSSRHNWNDFLARLPVQFERYRALGITYSDVAFAVDVKPQPSTSDARVSLDSQTGFGTIRYTLDGSAPTAASLAYASPFDVSLPVTLSTAAFENEKPLSHPTVVRLDALSVLRRNSYTMEQCTDDLPLAQKGAAASAVMVNVMNPCWIYRGLDLSVIAGMDVSVTHLPFNFQIGQDIKKIPLYPTAARDGQLEIHLDSCKGETLAILPLAEAAKDSGFTTLHRALSPRAGAHDVCFLFARRSVDPVWAIDWVQPLRKE